MAKSRLFSRRRFERCTRLFRSPKMAYALSLTPSRWPLKFTLVNGDILQLGVGRRSRRIWSWLLESWPDPGPITVEDGLVRIHCGEKSYLLRPNYADFMVFGEIIVRDVYNLGSLPTTTGTVVDLGANIGLFSLRAAQSAQRVIAVEPVASNLQLAETLLTEAEARDKVALIKAAICGDSGGTVRVFTSPKFPAGSSIFQNHTMRWSIGQCEDVARLSLADLFEQEQIEHCGLLKCDIEGAEFEALEAAPLELLQRIDHIVIEVHMNIASGSRQKLARLRNRLEAAHFQVSHPKETRWWGGLCGAVTVNARNLRAA